MKKKNSKFNYKAKNINELEITLPNLNYEIIKDENDIKSVIHEYDALNVGDRYTVDVGAYEVEYKINSITIPYGDKRIIKLCESKYNTTSLFVLPFIFENRLYASFVENNQGYLVNSYIDCNFVKLKDSYSIVCLLKYIKKSDRFKITEELYNKNKYLINKIDIDKNYVLYEFTIPDKYKACFDLILSGKYSKLSKTAINKILAFHGESVEGAMLDRIFKRDSEYIKNLEKSLDVSLDGCELWKKINEEDILTKDLL